MRDVGRSVLRMCKYSASNCIAIILSAIGLGGRELHTVARVNGCVFDRRTSGSMVSTGELGSSSPSVSGDRVSWISLILSLSAYV